MSNKNEAYRRISLVAKFEKKNAIGVLHPHTKQQGTIVF